ncbi:hypothetical protein J4470_00610 [Candidatus Woesearchaeota archaeon]|nr:hypothetical protein [Candidatus Woesearchaeota archaeon]
MNKVLLKFELGITTALLLSTAAYAQDNAVQTYFRYVRMALLELTDSLKNLNTSTKIAIIAALAFIAVMAYLKARDTASNNMRRARDLHKKAVELHEQGEDDEAAEHYQKASEYREKAEGQL